MLTRSSTFMYMFIGIYFHTAVVVVMALVFESTVCTRNTLTRLNLILFHYYNGRFIPCVK